jgi:hypothetical protein
MATWSMVMLTPQDASVLTSLAQYTRPSERWEELLNSLEKPDARMVGEALLNPQKYAEAPDDVRATVDRFRAWVENNKRRRLQREARQRSSHGR